MESLLGVSAAQRLLTFLAERPSQTFFVRELARVGGVSLGSAHSAVHGLAEAGLLKIEERGSRRFYGANLAHPMVRQWKVLVSLARLEPLLAALRGTAELVILFGSTASGTDHEGSDIDLYVRTSRPDAVRKVLESSTLAGRVQAVVKTALEEAEAERDSPVFLENVRRGLVLYDEGSRL